MKFVFDLIVGAHRSFLVRPELSIFSKAAKGNGLIMCVVTRCLEVSALGCEVCFDLARGKLLGPHLGIVMKRLSEERKGTIG